MQNNGGKIDMHLRIFIPFLNKSPSTDALELMSLNSKSDSSKYVILLE